jgi:excisionase family DNA binding protein
MSTLPSLASRSADELLTASEAARYLKTSVRSVTRLVGKGALSGVRLPIRGGLRIRVDHLRKAIEAASLPRNSVVLHLRNLSKTKTNGAVGSNDRAVLA